MKDWTSDKEHVPMPFCDAHPDYFYLHDSTKYGQYESIQGQWRKGKYPFEDTNFWANQIHQAIIEDNLIMLRGRR